jgi:transposase-like protein
MARMLAGIETLAQHQAQLRQSPQSYRPERCPGCAKAGLHCHGSYPRNAPRGEGMAYLLGPLLIPRFLCPACHASCSRVPQCLSPRRQYWWRAQQAVLAQLLAGASFRALARAMSPSRRTIARWWQRLEARIDVHALHLRSRFAALGRAVDWVAFWSLCLASMDLGEAMAWLDQDAVIVP